MKEIIRMQSTERMSHIVKYNGVLYLSGQVAGNAEWSVTRQTHECLRLVESLLAQGGSDKDHILSATIYLKEINDFGAMNSVWEAWLSDSPKPARACVEACMAAPEMLVEVAVVAAVRE